MALSRFELQNILYHLKEHPNPKYWLEQFSITVDIAGRTLFMAKDDIRDKVVFDLGCGTGRFAIGASLLGCKKAVGVDIDEEALKVARENVKIAEILARKRLENLIEWRREDIKNLKESCDTVIQLPPFALDEEFFKKALEIAKNIYSFHIGSEEKESRLMKIIAKEGAILEKKERFKYKIEWRNGKSSGYGLVLFVVRK